MSAEIHVFDPERGEASNLKPPHNIPVEQQVLGAILANNELLHRIGDFLLPDHFYESVHGRIYAACQRAAGVGQKATPYSLAPQFAGDADLKQVGGGPQYLAYLVASVISVRECEQHARIVFELHQRRAMIAFAEGLRVTAMDLAADQPAADILQDAGAELDRIADGGPDDGDAVSLDDAAAETVQNAEDIAAGKVAPGIPTELVTLDQKLGGLKPDHLIILAARPSMGKTALAVRIAGRAAKLGHPTLYFSLEEGRRGISSRLLSARTGIPYESILNGRVDANDIARLTRARDGLAPLLAIDETAALTLEQIRARALRRHRKTPIGLVVVDHLGLMRPPRHLDRADRRHHVEHFTAGLKALAKELHAPVIALSQLNREVEKRDDKRPRLSDLRDSGSIEQDADVVMFAFREEYYIEREKPRDPEKVVDWEIKRQKAENILDVIIDKNRHGSIGTVSLFCRIGLNQFGDLEKRDGL